jgi:hypothetical protein
MLLIRRLTQTPLQLIRAFALRGERDIVISHGRAEKNARYHRIRRVVRDLGLDLSRDQVFDRNNSAVFDGRRPIRFGRHDHVCDCLVTGDRQIELGELAHVVNHRSLPAARRQRWRDDRRTIYRLWIGGVDRGDRSDLYRIARVGDGNGASAHASYVDGACRRVSRGGNPIRTGSASSLPRRTESCHRNIDPACHKFHLVGRLALLARCKTRAFTISHCRTTNDLWGHIAFARGCRHRRTAAVSSQFRFHVIAWLICLSRNHRRGSRVYSLHLVVPSLRSGEGRDLRVRESYRRRSAWHFLRGRNCHRTHVGCCCSHHRFSGSHNYGTAATIARRAGFEPCA